MKKALSLATIKRFERDAKRLGVSVVARSPRGFMAAYKRAKGKISKLSPYWKNRRENFIKRHYAQVKKRKEPLFKNGAPTRRHLALIFWAWSPTPTKIRKVKRNPYKNYKYKTVGKRQSLDKRSIRTIRSGKALVKIGCPRGSWMPRKMKCKVGTRAYEVLTRKNPFNLKKIKQLRLTKPRKQLSRYNQKQLKSGIRVEMEHTRDRELAAIIAANHLDEMPDYYTRLKRMERKNPDVDIEYVDRRNKRFTIDSIGHFGGSILWIEKGGKILTESDTNEDGEELYHNDIWPEVGDRWRGRFEEGSGILSMVSPWGVETRPPVKLLNAVISLFSPTKIYVFS